MRAQNGQKIFRTVPKLIISLTKTNLFIQTESFVPSVCNN